MDDEVPAATERTGEEPAAPLPFEPSDGLPDDVSAAADELRRLVDAGASTPEELKALAARMREHRALEESRWRSEVRPALLQSKKRRFTMRDLRDAPDETRTTNGLALGLGILGGVLVLLLAATQSSFLWILVPVAAVLVYAYRQGKQEASGLPAPDDPPAPDATD